MMIEFDRLEAFPERAVPFVMALFRRTAALWPDLDRESTLQFGRAAKSHGVEALIHHLALEDDSWRSWPVGVWNHFTASASAHAAIEVLRRRDLIDVLSGLASCGSRPLIFKGAALAHTHYDRPELRPRSDTDFFIDRRDLDAVRTCFDRLGYATTYRAGRDLVFAQASFVRREYGVLHSYDCHWRVTNRLLVRGVLDYAECARYAVPIRALGPYALSLSNVHALIAACVHRVAHHGGSNRLIWLADIHRLAGRMSRTELESFWKLAREREVAQICGDGFKAAEQWFGTLPQPSVETTIRERSSVLLRPRLNRVQLLWYDVLSLPNWRERALLLSQVAVPSPDAVLGPGMSRAALPYAYARRFLRGVRSWFRS